MLKNASEASIRETYKTLNERVSTQMRIVRPKNEATRR